MIDVQNVLRDVPHFETYCSVTKQNALVESLRLDPRFNVDVAGSSVGGVPIYHVRFGKGRVKALFVGGVHCHETIGGLVNFSLLTLLQRDHEELLGADVEWHVVPCADPDGTILNEGWSQKPFTLDSYMRNYYFQSHPDKVEGTFPFKYKRCSWNQPSQEAQALQKVLDRVRPNFYFCQHNSFAGGTYFFVTQRLDPKYYQRIQELTRQHGIPLTVPPDYPEWCATLADSIYESPGGTYRKLYDRLEKFVAAPEELLCGTGSEEYLLELEPGAQVLVSEFPHVTHPACGSKLDTHQNWRHLRIRLNADSRFIFTLILEEYEKVKSDLDPESPFFRDTLSRIDSVREKLCEEVPFSAATRDLLFTPSYSRTMTEDDRFNAYLYDGFAFLRHSYGFVRLLKASRQTPAVRQAIERLDRAFDEALQEIAQKVDFGAFEVIECDTLAKVQLGSALTVLSSLLDRLPDAHRGP